ncbi:MAG TPA: nucleotide exchange factor GrpE [Bacteroidales bacterium]|nr:nucleotide exchange factor GrpE [Bacteroidales bacterium]
MKKKFSEKEENAQNNGETTQQTGENIENNEDSVTTEVISASDPQGEQEAKEQDTDKVLAELRSMEEKLAEMQDKYIRLSAEFDNYRKRTLKEKMELSKYAEENVLSKLIPFMDDFDRAMQHIDSTDNEAMKNGINLIYMKFSEFLKQNGIKEIEAKGSDFNVDLHEAVAKVPVEDENKGKVVDVVLKGYYLRDKVLRFSKVVVGE